MSLSILTIANYTVDIVNIVGLVSWMNCDNFIIFVLACGANSIEAALTAIYALLI